MEAVRGIKRKSSQEKIIHKKIKTDGRVKRKSDFLETQRPKKQRKIEIKCDFCHEYFKSENALKRHGKNVHDFPKDIGPDLKRKRTDTTFSGSYTKRHKSQPHKPISYQNYF